MLGGGNLAGVQGLYQGGQQGRGQAFGHRQADQALIGFLQQARLHSQLSGLQGVGQIDTTQQTLGVGRAGHLDQRQAQTGQRAQPALAHRAVRGAQTNAAQAVRVQLQNLQAGQCIVPGVEAWLAGGFVLGHGLAVAAGF